MTIIHAPTLVLIVIDNLPGGGGGGGTRVNSVCWVCAAPLCSIIVYSVSNHRPNLSHLLGKCNFRDPT